MPQNQHDTIDFKPFFDMVVGILFILLILIAAQLFFSRFETDSPEAQAQQKRAARLADQELFLNSIAAALKISGFKPQVDRVANRVSVALDELTLAASKTESASWPKPDPTKVVLFANSVLTKTACARVETNAACDRRFDLSFAQVGFALTLGGLPLGATPHSTAQVYGLNLGASLFSAMPEVLSWNGYLGTAMFEQAIKIAPTSMGPGTLAAEFTFSPNN